MENKEQENMIKTLLQIHNYLTDDKCNFTSEDSVLLEDIHNVLHEKIKSYILNLKQK